MPEKLTTQILITVMTYPHPSEGYGELVCTAGVTESGEWVRLYPIDYRYRARNQQFRKYQWIEVALGPAGAGNDNRKESRRPNLDSIRLLGEPLSTRDNWRDRREIIDRLRHFTRNELVSLHEQDKTSLGIVRPSRVLDLEIREANPEWKPEWQSLFKQLTLFGPVQKPLQKLPYTFHYVFECHDSNGTTHTAMCEDWELGVLFLREVERLACPKKAADSVREKFLGELCGPGKDTRFFMGTHFPYNTWLVLGVFWPNRTSQKSLAFD